MTIEPRYFMVYDTDNSGDYELLIVGPSPKFKGEIAMTMFQLDDQLLEDGTALVVQEGFVPKFDITLKLNRAENIRYRNSIDAQIGDSIETTCSSFDDWFDNYKNELDYLDNEIVEIDENEAFKLDIKMLDPYWVYGSSQYSIDKSYSRHSKCITDEEQRKKDKETSLKLQSYMSEMLYEIEKHSKITRTYELTLEDLPF